MDIDVGLRCTAEAHSPPPSRLLAEEAEEDEEEETCFLLSASGYIRLRFWQRTRADADYGNLINRQPHMITAAAQYPKVKIKHTYFNSINNITLCVVLFDV